MAICVILNSHQVLACLDGYMNIALEQTEEYANGQANKRWTKMHIMTKTCAAKEQVWRRLHPWQQRSLHLHRPQAVEPRRDCFWVEMFCFLPFFSQLWRNSLIFLNSSMCFVNPLKVWSGWSPILLEKVCPIAKCGRVKWIFQRKIALWQSGWRWWTGRPRGTSPWARMLCSSLTASGWRTTCAAWLITLVPSLKHAGIWGWCWSGFSVLVKS